MRRAKARQAKTKPVRRVVFSPPRVTVKALTNTISVRIIVTGKSGDYASQSGRCPYRRHSGVSSVPVLCDRSPAVNARRRHLHSRPPCRQQSIADRSASRRTADSADHPRRIPPQSIV